MRILLACLLAAASFGIAVPANADFTNNHLCVVHDGHYHCPDVCLPQGGSLVDCDDGIAAEYRQEVPPLSTETLE